MNARFLGLIGLIILLLSAAGASGAQDESETLLFAPSPLESVPAGSLGIEAGNASAAFVNMMTFTRPWQSLEWGEVEVDEQGWPLGDALTVVFDERPCCVFFPEEMDNRIDDPAVSQIDMSGTYTLSFRGQAVLLDLGGDGESFIVANQVYDEATGITTADIIQRPGQQLMVIGFTDTDGGVKDVRLIRPGYPHDTTQIFTDEFLNSLMPYSTLRLMGWADINSNAGVSFDDPDSALEWSERHTPDNATQQSYGGQFGIAWEYAILLANTLQKDLWINIPAPASDDYIRELALLLRDGNEFTGNQGLDDGLNLYLEHSNEVWNFGFPQQPYNVAAARAEVNADSASILNIPENENENIWGVRRHARRVVEIGAIMSEVFGEGSLNTRVRPVLAWWVINPVDYREMLAWMSTHLGEPASLIYAISGASYFSLAEAQTNADVAQIFGAFCLDSGRNGEDTERLSQLADEYGLRYFAYEGGPDSATADRGVTNVANRALAMRQPEIGLLIARHIRTQFFDRGGDLFMYFTSLGKNTRFGYYGVTDDPSNLFTPQLAALYALMGSGAPTTGTGLTGVYFSDPDLETVAATRHDRTVDFTDWGTASPAYKMPFNGFSARWQGWVRVPETVTNFTVGAIANGGVRIYLDDKLLVDQWDSQGFVIGATEGRDMVAMDYLPLTIEYRATSETPSIQLTWAWSGRLGEVIPASALYGAVPPLNWEVYDSVCEGYELTEVSTAASNAPATTVSFAASAPVIDGEVDEIWSQTRPLNINLSLMGEFDDADLSGAVHLLYDADYLYALYHVSDDTLTTDSEYQWEDDSVELYLDGGNEKSSGSYDWNDEQYNFRYGDTEVWSQRGYKSGVLFANTATDEGYRVEVAIPWKVLGIVAEAGTKIGFDAHINDDDDGDVRDAKVSAFAMIDDSWANPASFGTLELGPQE